MGFRLASPWFLLLLLVIPALAILRRRGGTRWRPAGIRYADFRPLRVAYRSWRLRLRPLLVLLRWGALALMVLALARPQIVNAHQIVKGEGVDIALALDISGSMASLDFEPRNRLEAAKSVIEDFIARRPYDRIGLSVFAAQAFSQSPLTTDHRVLSRLLQSVNLAPKLGLEDGTAIGLGLANAANMLKDSSAKSKVVILLTDGVNNAGQIDPLTAAEAAKTLGIRVYTIGMGRQGMVPVPQQTLFGERIVLAESLLDEALLQQIAERTGGRFYRAEDTQSLQQVYQEINQMEKSEVEIHTFHRYQELAPGLMFPTLVLLLVEMVLHQTIFQELP